MRSLSEAPGRGPAGDYALWDGDGTCILHDADHVLPEQDLDIAQRKEKWFADQGSHGASGSFVMLLKRNSGQAGPVLI